MKVFLYINAIHHGGAERVMVNLAKEYIKFGHEVFLITSFKADWEYEIDAGVKRIILGNNSGNFIRRNVLLTKRLRHEIRTEKPDIIISFMAEPNFRALVAAIGTKTKNIISIRNDPNREYPSTLFRIAARILYRLADRVVFQTKDAQNWFPKSIQSKSVIIYNPVAEEFYVQKAVHNRKDIVTTGRLTSQKNHAMLIKSFARIADNIDDNLYIYGHGEMRKELEDLIDKLNLSERVFLPGPVNDVKCAINSAKLFVLSSDYEGMPNSLMEAMALGVPCISTDCPCGGPKMLLENEKYLSAVNDCEKMAKKMLAIVMSEEEQQEASEYVKARSKFFWCKTIYNEWNELICDTQLKARQ